MDINVATGLLTKGQFCPSPHYNERPMGQCIDLLVIHGISLPPGKFGGNDVVDFFTDQLDVNKHPYFKEIADLKVSSHVFIQRSGRLWQFVPFTKRAWHAGQSVFQNRDNCNDFSIGIELEGTDTLPYTWRQYQQLVKVTQLIMHHFPHITAERIVGHCHIAPGRKTDPGPFFDWPFYYQLIMSK